MTVDEFVKTKVQPEFRPIVAAVRDLIRKYARSAYVEDKYGLLRGVAKHAKRVQMKSLAGVN